MKRNAILWTLCGAMLLLAGCGTAETTETVNPPAVEAVSMQESETVDAVITFTDTGASVEGVGTEIDDDGEVDIVAGGVYRVTGASENARVVVDAADTEVVKIILDGCDLTCPDDEVIYVKTARSAVVELASGTENVLTSGDAPAGLLSDVIPDEEAAGAALRYKCPLTITGTGILTVNGFVNNGIGGSDELTIEDGVIAVTAVNDAVKSKADIELTGGVISISSAGDGIQAEADVTITGGAVSILTGVGAADADMKVSDSAFMSGGSPEMRGDMDETADVSRKGIKSGADITITGGSIAVDAEDDAIHAGGNIIIAGGDLALGSGDDGVHADGTLTITGGTVDVRLCYEGLEAKNIRIDDGNVNIVATDDGMNVNGGDFGGFRGASGEASAETEDAADEAEEIATELRITGGLVAVDSGGDGLDSNGSIYIEGGEVYVSGPSSDWDAAIDYGEGSSEFIITGGILMAGGYSGMAEAPHASENAQASIWYAFEDYAGDGAVCTLTDADGNVILSFPFVHGYNCVVLSSPDIAVGETYTLTVGDMSAEIEMTSASFSNHTRGGMGGMRMGGGSREASGEVESEDVSE